MWREHESLPRLARGGVDQTTALALLPHALDRFLAAKENALGVDVEDLVPSTIRLLVVLIVG